MPVQNPAASVTEHVARHVSEYYANREAKNGNDQIVLRLFPEHLGELKVNMKMDNQRLTVEIVTENRMVRDALIQNSDTLKDSLAKQNIKMDSFDVSTGSNNSGFGGRGHNDWRELAQNRQSLHWQQSGGYNVPKAVIPTKLAYNPQAEYGMLDVHF
jgi:flagellar hook-length control protein FliK